MQPSQPRIQTAGPGINVSHSCERYLTRCSFLTPRDYWLIVIQRLFLLSVRGGDVFKQPSPELINQNLSGRFLLLLEASTRRKSNREHQNGLRIFEPTPREEFQNPYQYGFTLKIF